MIARTLLLRSIIPAMFVFIADEKHTLTLNAAFGDNKKAIIFHFAAKSYLLLAS